MTSIPVPVLEAELVEDSTFTLDFAMLCTRLHCGAGEALDLVHYGVLHPRGQSPQHWRFSSLDVYRAQLSRRLVRDLELDLAGAALAVELLERLSPACP